MNVNVVEEVERFMYLGSLLRKNGCFEKVMNHRIKCGWMK